MEFKTKKCKNCEKPFKQFNSLQNVCSPRCASEQKARKEKEEKRLLIRLQKKYKAANSAAF
jgi:hypothetical protein